MTGDIQKSITANGIRAQNGSGAAWPRSAAPGSPIALRAGAGATRSRTGDAAGRLLFALTAGGGTTAFLAGGCGLRFDLCFFDMRPRQHRVARNVPRDRRKVAHGE